MPENLAALGRALQDPADWAATMTGTCRGRTVKGLADGVDFDSGEDEPYWDRLWFPFSGLEGEAFVIDMRPGAGQGRLGSASVDGTGDFSVGWPNLTAFLAETADALETGATVLRQQPYLTTTGRLWWARPGQSRWYDGTALTPVHRGEDA